MSRFRILKALLVTIAVVVALGLLGALAIRVYGARKLALVSERYEREAGPLGVRPLPLPHVAVEQNSVTWQRPGVLAVVYFPNDSSLVGSLSAKQFSTWTAEDAANLGTIIERNRPAIELLDRSRGLKASNWDIPYGAGADAKIPNLLAAINAAKLLNARGRLALGRGVRETALASVETLGTLARSHEAEKPLILLLIGLAIEKLQLALVNDLLAAPLATPAELDRLEASLCDADLKRAVRESIRFDAATYADDVRADAVLDTVDAPVRALLAGVMTNVVAAAMLEASLAADKHAGEPISAPIPDADSEHREKGWLARLPVVIGGNLTSASARATATTSARELARMAITLRREALKTGRYPAGLPAIEGVPATDPLTGGPRDYVVNGDGSAELRSKTTTEIVKSISPGSQLSYEALYVWELAAPRSK